jgi:hypothetical protein
MSGLLRLRRRFADRFLVGLGLDARCAADFSALTPLIIVLLLVGARLVIFVDREVGVNFILLLVGRLNNTNVSLVI